MLKNVDALNDTDSFGSRAAQNFNNGFSCSESVVKAAIDKGIVPEELLSCATSFSGGMGSGCLCGAIAASQLIIGYLHGKGKTERARILAKELIDEFKKSHKATCCKVLTHGLEFNSSERKSHCTSTVFDCASMLDKILKENGSFIKTN